MPHGTGKNSEHGMTVPLRKMGIRISDAPRTHLPYTEPRIIYDATWPIPCSLFVQLPASPERPDANNPTCLIIELGERPESKTVEFPPHHHSYNQTGMRCPICLAENVTAYAIADAEAITVDGTTR
jgi:hypothetical protein